MIVLMVLALTFQSCSPLVSQLESWVYGQGYARSTRLTLSKSLEMVDSTRGRHIMIVPMVHIGSAEDYEKIAYFLDGLKANGYVTFTEGITWPLSLTDSAAIDTLMRKYRRALGYSVNPYLSDRSSKHNGWAVQDYELMHLNTDRDIDTDIPVDEFVRQYELKYGPIVLDDYDFYCPLYGNDQYKRKREKGFNQKFNSIVCDYRNTVLWNHIVNDGYDKIAIVYGGAHTRMLKYNLQKEGFQMKHSRRKKR